MNISDFKSVRKIRYHKCIKSRIVAREFIDLRCLRCMIECWNKSNAIAESTVFFSVYLLIVEELGKDCEENDW